MLQIFFFWTFNKKLTFSLENRWTRQPEFVGSWLGLAERVVVLFGLKELLVVMKMSFICFHFFKISHVMDAFILVSQTVKLVDNFKVDCDPRTIQVKTLGMPMLSSVLTYKESWKSLYENDLLCSWSRWINSFLFKLLFCPFLFGTIELNTSISIGINF